MAKNLALATIKSAGSSTTRTLQDRFGEVYNVKDYGAIGNGIADDTTAIQNTINAAENKSVVFFPQGTYLVSSTLNCNNSQSIIFRGVGKASKITGTFSAFVVKRVNVNADPSISIFDSLYIQNGSSNSLAGGIWWENCIGLSITDCMIEAYKGFKTTDSLFGLAIRNVNMRNNGSGTTLTGSVGISIEGNGIGGPCDISNVNITGFGKAISWGPGGGHLHGSRFEENGTAISLNNSNAATTISSVSSEANDIGIEVSGGNYATIMSFGALGDPFCTYSATNRSHYGIHTMDCNDSTIMDSNSVGEFSTAAFGIDTRNVGFLVSQHRQTWIGCSGSNSSALGGVYWQLGSDTSGVDFIACKDVPDRTNIFSELQSYSPPGTVRRITDCNTTTVGAKAAGGGANDRLVMKIHGSNQWIVLGPGI